MVEIENLDELRKVKESDYGFVIIIEDDKPVIHISNCKTISENDFSVKKTSSNYHWFSTYSLAQKELGDLESCIVCNPDSD